MPVVRRVASTLNSQSKQCLLQWKGENRGRERKGGAREERREERRKHEVIKNIGEEVRGKGVALSQLLTFLPAPFLPVPLSTCTLPTCSPSHLFPFPPASFPAVPLLTCSPSHLLPFPPASFPPAPLLTCSPSHLLPFPLHPSHLLPFWLSSLQLSPHMYPCYLPCRFFINHDALNRSAALNSCHPWKFYFCGFGVKLIPCAMAFFPLTLNFISDSMTQ